MYLMSSSRQPTAALTESQAREHATYGVVLPQGVEQQQNGSAGRKDSSHLYVNGVLMGEGGHEYVNSGTTRPVSGAFVIDETAALIDFLHNPPGVENTGSSQVSSCKNKTE